ncbi:hypothetical protein [Rummeliibacillus pycnus]|uniref:hypothetical protein n=1 Tax=Rummeliibacillus pycnus TaxID=101070 RepID=UPI0037CCA026
MKSFKSNRVIIILIVFLVVAIPIIIGQIIRIPLGNWTIGDENSWVSFFGSYIGGVLGGIVAFGVAWIQINNLKKEVIENSRTFLSSATPVRKLSSDNVNRREKYRVLLTDDFEAMSADDKDIPYYSVVRYGGTDVVWNCSLQATVGKTMDFIETDTIKVWIDYFEKDEELLIPLCSKKLKMLQPFIKEIEVTYETEKKEKMKFYQSEKKQIRQHYIIGEGEEELIHEIEVNNTRWIER